VSESQPGTGRMRSILEILESVEGARHTLVLIGELDLSSAPAVQARVAEIVPQAREIVLDLRELSFMDSSGIRAILVSDELCARSRCELALLPGRPNVQRLFEVSGLTDLLPFIEP
jgi:anti-sigma B factor antagonist